MGWNGGETLSSHISFFRSPGVLLWGAEQTQQGTVGTVLWGCTVAREVAQCWGTWCSNEGFGMGARDMAQQQGMWRGDERHGTAARDMSQC